MVLHHLDRAQNVIKVLMGEQQRVHLHPPSFQPGSHTLRRIHQKCAAGQFQYITIGLGDPAREHRNLTHIYPRMETGGQFKQQPAKSAAIL